MPELGRGESATLPGCFISSRDVDVSAAIDPWHIQGDGPDRIVPSVGAGRLRSCSLGSFQLPASSGLSVSILRILNLLT